MPPVGSATWRLHALAIAATLLLVAGCVQPGSRTRAGSNTAAAVERAHCRGAGQATAQAIPLYMKGEYDAALTHFEQAATAATGCPDAHYNVGQTLTRLSRHEAALEAYSRARHLNPRHARAILGQVTALVAVRERRYVAQDPTVLLQLANLIEPDLLGLRGPLADANPDAAAGILRGEPRIDAVVQPDPGYSHYQQFAVPAKPDAAMLSRIALAASLLSPMDDTLAPAAMSLALRLAPEDAEVRRNHAFFERTVEQRTGGVTLQRSEVLFRRALSADPNDPAALFGLAQIYLQRPIESTCKPIGEPDRRRQRVQVSCDAHTREAIDIAGRLIRLYPDRPVGFIARAEAMLRHRDPDAAAADVREALSREPGNVGARIALARTLSGKGRRAEAIDQYRQALVDHPDHPWALLAGANELAELGQTEEAIDWWLAYCATRSLYVQEASAPATYNLTPFLDSLGLHPSDTHPRLEPVQDCFGKFNAAWTRMEIVWFAPAQVSAIRRMAEERDSARLRQIADRADEYLRLAKPPRP